MAENYVKFRRGTPEAFQLILKNNAAELDTLYFIYEDDKAVGELYLGSKLIAGIQTDYVTKEAAKAYLTTEAAAETYLPSETAEATYAPLGIIGDTSTWENPDNTIVAKINSLEGKIDSVEKIVGNEELEEG